MRIPKVAIGSTLIGLLLLTGCGGSGPNNGQADAPAEKASSPVTIRVLQYSTDITDADFQSLLAEPVKKKYPHITLELVRLAKGTTLQDLVATGEVPDLIYTGSRQIENFKNLGIPADLNELIKKNKYDLSALNTDVVNIIRQRGEKGELYAMPIFLNFSALYYNKDIFDKFGVSYPTDGMTWEDAIALGKKVARTENGVTYKPLNPNAFVNFGAPYQVNYVNPDNHTAVINNEAVKKALTLYKQVADLPGNKDSVTNARSRFQKEQDLAMQPDFAEILGELAESGKTGNPINWDVVSYPSLADAPGLGYETIAFMLMLSSSSKHPDDAFAAIQAITSAENQLKLTRGGKVPALKDPQLLESFGADVPGLKGKNLKGIFKSKPSPSPKRSKYEDVARPVLNAYVQKVIKDEIDINSALRLAEEEANSKIKAQNNQ
ncbi:extracellular solute-binding protein [Paenibacillus hemerocallicola]|uniref:Extracellular solute-binding protein n=1 Tax=Paenibacillus hemerocallicola TaxID=1172614 RepID=A0A5C4SYG0_9BACL|nr:extracellular solute-binding protein [Paenibacillus hemerocallicola]TNJ61581.1 extracellular solute-binding protein [Paenibacillus hemerocallicola]